LLKSIFKEETLDFLLFLMVTAATKLLSSAEMA